MPPDPTSLDQLHDIVAPGPVAWWPPAPGWYVVAAFAGLGLILLTWKWLKHRLANAYRRAALAELEELAHASSDDAQLIPNVSQLLKRTALCVYPRTSVASLSGEAWLALLDQSLESQEFRQGPGRVLLRAYDASPDRLEPGDRAALVALAKRWIERHQVRDAMDTHELAVAC